MASQDDDVNAPANELNARYTIHGEALCKVDLRTKAKTRAVTVDGGDLSVSEATLTFDKGECAHK